MTCHSSFITRHFHRKPPPLAPPPREEARYDRLSVTDLDYEPRREEIRRARRQFGWILVGTGVAVPLMAWGVASFIVGIVAAVSSKPGDPNIGAGCMGLACIYVSLFYALIAIVYGISFLVRNRK